MGIGAGFGGAFVRGLFRYASEKAVWVEPRVFGWRLQAEPAFGMPGFWRRFLILSRAEEKGPPGLAAGLSVVLSFVGSSAARQR
ncbi:hypothetical protein GCM10027567_17180 [Spongiibacter taiwanensis]